MNPLRILIASSVALVAACGTAGKAIPASETVVELVNEQAGLDLDLGEAVALVLPPSTGGPWRLASDTPRAVALSRFQPVRVQPGDGLAEGSWWVGAIGARSGTDRLVFTTVPVGGEPESGQFRVVNAIVERSLRERP
jgi:hypothetical protein